MNEAPPDRRLPSTEIIAAVGIEEAVGTTTAAVNLALALAAAGRSVLLIDLDPKASASRMVGCEDKAHGGTARILLEASLDEGMLAETRVGTLRLATAGAGLGRVESELAMMGGSQTRLYQALTRPSASRPHFDHVVLDCPNSLDLLTRNALIAAHRLLVPLPCDSRAIDSLPALLTTINRLRAGLSHPLYGIQFLISRRGLEPEQQALVDRVRQEYGRMTLLSEIPADAAAEEAASRGQPLLIGATSSRAGQACLSMAAEWLTLGEPGDQPDGTWLFDHRKGRMSLYREQILAGIGRWTLDASSPLYDADDTMRQQDAMALDALLQPPPPARHIGLDWRLPSWRPKPELLRRAGLIGGIGVAAILLIGWLSSPNQRLAIAAWLISSDDDWRFGSRLLSRADANAYRELLFAARLVQDNREQLILCSDDARRDGSGGACMIHLPAAPARPR